MTGKARGSPYQGYAGRLGRVKGGRSSIGFRRLADFEMEVLLERVERAGVLMSATWAEYRAKGDGRVVPASN